MLDDRRFGLSRHAVLPGPLLLDGGVSLAPIEIAYETYGTLAPAADNAILVCHALTGDHHVASAHPRTGRPGWWTRMVGAGKPIDPARHFVVCANVLGSCMGSSGPRTVDPATGAPYAMGFPVITIRDMVRAQALLLDHLGVRALAAAVGGSMGGMQVLEWAATFPSRVRKAVVIASAARHSAQNIAFHEVGRQAIMADPAWRGGDYYGTGAPPAAGLAVARMAAHITYLSEAGLTEKFGRRLQDRGQVGFGFDADFQVESYLRHQGISFVDRFDANSYLYITRAMDYFDLAGEHGGQLARAFAGSSTRFCLVSFDTDWLYPTAETRAVVHALNAAGAAVSFVELSAPHGHDSFLLDVPELNAVVDGFLRAGGGPVILRPDLAIIARAVRKDGRVLDIGCGDGALMAVMRDAGQDVRGLEIDPANVSAAVARGLSVAQGDADTDLAYYPDDAFDYAVLSQTLQTTRVPDRVLGAMLRIAPRAFVSFPNFAYWRVRWSLMWGGRMPVTPALPVSWYETPNIHQLTVDDFRAFVAERGIAVEDAWFLAGGRRIARAGANLRAEQAVFLLRR